MTRAAPIATSFNAGELAPTIEGRVDLTKYNNGCKLLENFIPLVQGPAQRRGGTRFVAELKDSSKRAWLRRFEFSATQAFILEFGDQYLRFYANHGQLLTGAVTAWSNATAYEVGDLASRLGVNYYCIAAHTNQQPPNATYWYPLTGSIYEIPTPYLLADLTNDEGAFALKTEQSGDVLYIAGAGIYPPMTLTRFGNTDWVLQEYAPDTGPFLAENTDKVIAIWASAQTGSVTLNASANVFSATDIGRLIRLKPQNLDIYPWEADVTVVAGDYRRYDGRTYKALNGNKTGTSPPIHDEGVARDGDGAGIGVYWEFEDPGYGIARISAYTSPTQVTATVVKKFPANVVGSSKTITGATAADPVVITSNAHGFANDKTVYIFGVGGMTQINNLFFTTSAVAANTFTLTEVNGAAYSAYTSGGTAVLNATSRWSLGAWSETTEYPRAVKFYKNRLWWAGQRFLWSSVPSQYDDLSPDIAGLITTDSAITVPVVAEDVNDILWLMAADKLIVGTPGGEFAVGPITTVDPIGPENVDVVRQSKKRCRSVQPVLVGTQVIYVQRAGRRLLALEYSFEIDRYRSNNMNALAPHTTKSGIVGMAFQAEPDPIIWAHLANGGLRGFTFDVEQDVTAWHPHPIGGTAIIEATETMTSPDGDREDVWLIGRRTINGGTKRYVEFIERPYESGDDQADVFYVDSGLTYDGAPATVITGLGHLEGQTVQICADGASHPNKTVSSGQITLDRAASVVHVGLAAPARLVTMRLEAGSQVGTAQGKTKRVHNATVRLLDTLGGKMGMYGRPLTEIQYRRPSMPMDQPPAIFSGDKEVTVDGDYETACQIEVLQDQPFPMTVAAVMPRLQTYDAK